MASEMSDKEMTSLGYRFSAPKVGTYLGAFFYFLEGKPIAFWSRAHLRRGIHTPRVSKVVQGVG